MAGLPAARAPEDCDRLFAERARAGDLEGLVALYEAGGCYVGRDAVAVGHDAIRRALARVAASRPRLQCDIVRVVRSGEELAVLYNDWSILESGPDGDRVARKGRAMELVRRQADGSWRFVFDDPYGRG